MNPADLIQRLRGRARQLDNAGDGLGYYSRGDAILDREAADTLASKDAALAEIRAELERAEATCTAWQEVYEGIEAHLQDRIAMQDQASPETYLRTIRADVARVIESSKKIVAARWASAARERAATERAESELALVKKALEPFAVELGKNYDNVADNVPFTAYFSVGQIRAASRSISQDGEER